MQSIPDRTAKVEQWMSQAAPGVFPDGRFDALVRAALRPSDAPDAWDAYCRDLGDTPADDGEARLFPLVATHLKARGVATQDPRIQAARRRALALGTLCLQAAEQVNALFAHHGIDVVFTKGLALQITEYRNPVLRSFSDIDCCIRVEDIPAVVALAAAQGWHNSMNLIPEAASVIEAHAEMTFQLPSGVCLDIHWVPRRAFAYRPKLIQQFFDTAEVVEWRGQDWRVPSATWRLIETIEHGVEANDVPPIRWVPDAIRVLENPANTIDWDAIARAATAARLQVVFLAGLQSLAGLTDSVTTAHLARFPAPTRGLQAIEFRARMRRGASLSYRLKREVLHYLLRAPGPFVQRLAGLPAFLIQGAGRSAGLRDFLRRLITHRGEQ